MKPAKEKNEWHLDSSWQSATPASLAVLWIATPHRDDDAEWTGVLDAAGTLQNLLLPIVALQFYGSAEAIREKRDVVPKAVEIVRNFPGVIDGNLTGGRGISVLDFSGMEGSTAWLQRVASRLEDAEKKLRREGWKFNPVTKKTSRIAEHKGKDLLVLCVWAIYTVKHRKEYGGASTAKKHSIRRKIASVLAPYFDAAELSPESGAPIYMAIWKGENPPK